MILLWKISPLLSFNEQRGNVQLHQQSSLYVKMYFEYSGAALAFRIVSCFHTAVVIARVCLCFVLSVTPVGRWLSTWTMANMRTRCQALHNRRTQSPPSPPSQLPFSLCAAFVLSGLICVGIYHGKEGTQKNLALVWKKSHLQSFTLTKTAFYHYNNLRQWHISASFISSNKQTNGDTRAPILRSRMCRARHPPSLCAPRIR